MGLTNGLLVVIDGAIKPRGELIRLSQLSVCFRGVNVLVLLYFYRSESFIVLPDFDTILCYTSHIRTGYRVWIVVIEEPL